MLAEKAAGYRERHEIFVVRDVKQTVALLDRLKILLEALDRLLLFVVPFSSEV